MELKTDLNQRERAHGDCRAVTPTDEELEAAYEKA